MMSTYTEYADAACVSQCARYGTMGHICLPQPFLPKYVNYRRHKRNIPAKGQSSDLQHSSKVLPPAHQRLPEMRLPELKSGHL
jgi:hypothetical protein